MEERKGTGLGGSRLVPSVQELVKESLVDVPPQYIRLDQDPPIISWPPSSLCEVPVIDLEQLTSDDSSADHELQKLHLACKDWGFFQIINHGVSGSLLDRVKKETQEFFKLPMEEKAKLWQTAEDIEGFGQAFVVSEEQKLDWADMFYVVTLPLHIRKPRLFSNLPLSFRSV
ncbi:hypothetical protein E3N88_29671 [Mikania micrantha]|uniref:Non-haem dioxygenase N-terminal domain-containing protein n=1 Tax=Mikania micrantha TaxID=192012 RepID=A0A5N6MK28_9ASTR|nr:hypothetical protein E3N88_29671 [Mikania micrantha]